MEMRSKLRALVLITTSMRSRVGRINKNIIRDLLGSAKGPGTIAGIGKDHILIGMKVLAFEEATYGTACYKCHIPDYINRGPEYPWFVPKSCIDFNTDAKENYIAYNYKNKRR